MIDDFNKIYLRLAANKLTLNLTKTEFMLLVPRHGLSTISKIPYFMIHDHPVMQGPSTWRHIDQNLNWNCHTLNVCKKIASALCAIKRISHPHFVAKDNEYKCPKFRNQGQTTTAGATFLTLCEK